MPRKNIMMDNDTEELVPEPGYVNPGRSVYSAPRGSVYTSGTYQQALTGNYYNYKVDPLQALMNSRPIGHGKSWGNDRSSVVVRGEAVPGASRGVGQPTIDGFFNGNEELQRQYNDEIKQAVMQEFIRQMVESTAKNKLNPPKRR